MEDEIEALNNRVQELEKENFDMRNENKNLKRILKSNNFSLNSEFNIANEYQDRSPEIRAFLNKTEQSIDKRNLNLSINNPEMSAQE